MTIESCSKKHIAVVIMIVGPMLLAFGGSIALVKYTYGADLQAVEAVRQQSQVNALKVNEVTARNEERYKAILEMLQDVKQELRDVKRQMPFSSKGP